MHSAEITKPSISTDARALPIAFSVATIVDPEVLIVDEILSVGDLAFQQKSEEKSLVFIDHCRFFHSAGTAVETLKGAQSTLFTLSNCEFIAGDVLKVIDDIEDKPDIIVLDPPRDGIHPKAIEKIIAYGVDEMVYISCKPTSLARDLEILQARGYKVVRGCAIDQFVNTLHCESIVLLKKVKDNCVEDNNTGKNYNGNEPEVEDCGCIYG